MFDAAYENDLALVLELLRQGAELEEMVRIGGMDVKVAAPGMEG